MSKLTAAQLRVRAEARRDAAREDVASRRPVITRLAERENETEVAKKRAEKQLTEQARRRFLALQKQEATIPRTLVLRAAEDAPAKAKAFDIERHKWILAMNPRRIMNTGKNTPGEPTFLCKKSSRGKLRCSPTPTYIEHGETGVRYRTGMPETYGTTKSKKGIPGVCKYEVVFKNGVKKFGVYYGHRKEPQLFNTKEKAMRFQAECKKSHGIKGLGRKRAKR